MFHFHCYIVKIFNSRCTLYTLLGQDRKMWFLWFYEIFRIIELKCGDYCRICSEIAVSLILTRLHDVLRKLHFTTAEKKFTRVQKQKFRRRSREAQ